jgi:hypothetical protein
MRFGALADGVYDVVHVLDDKIHGDELKVPPVFPSFQVTFPVGVVGELELSITVTVNGIAIPDTRGEEFGDIIIEVVSNETTVSESGTEIIIR